jgi:hypothetical protein
VIAPLDLGRAPSAMPLASKIKTKQEAATFPAPLLCSGASKSSKGLSSGRIGPTGECARESDHVWAVIGDQHRRRSLHFKDLSCYTPTATRRHSHALWERNASTPRECCETDRARFASAEIYSQAQKRANLSPPLSACASFCTS